jgi:hypothetical protein
MVGRSVPPEGATLTGSEADGLADAYSRLREASRELASTLGIDAREFDSELPPYEPAAAGMMGPRALLERASQASHAATLLRSLAGYLEGLIEAVVLDQQISMEQVRAAREAARQPPGFR